MHFNTFRTLFYGLVNFGEKLLVGHSPHRILFMKLYGKYTKFEMSTRIYKKTRGKSQNQLGFTRYLCHILYGVMMMVLLKPYEYVNQFSQFIQFQ